MIAGIVITTIVFLIIGFFVVILVAYINQRKKKHLEEKLAMQSSFQQELLRTQLEIQEQTFNHVSQEIHDNVGQILSLAKVQVNIMNESGDMNKEMLNEVKENIGKAMIDLRDIAKSLSSERIKSQSIHNAVINETERINKSGIIYILVSVEGDERKMDEQKKLILFRIVQECIQNIIKHAGASQVNISFNYSPQALQTIIKDNGKGFDIEDEKNKSTGLGLSNIKTRASLTGGSVNIESIQAQGTTISINMPYL